MYTPEEIVKINSQGINYVMYQTKYDTYFFISYVYFKFDNILLLGK